MAATVNAVFLYKGWYRTQLYADWQEGKAPCEFLYGLAHLDPERFTARAAQDHPVWHEKKRITPPPITQNLLNRLGMGFMHALVRKHVPKLRQADVAVSTVDTLGLPLARLKARGELSTPLVYFCQGLSHRMAALAPDDPERDDPARRLLLPLYREYLAAVERIVVLGQGAKQPLVEMFGLPEERVAVLPFGVDEHFWSPAEEGQTDQTDGPILSIGSDPARDYETLIRAAGDRALHIVTRLAISQWKPGPGVVCSTRHDHTELRQLFRGCRFVVIPLQDVDQPSGQSATLQAMACGKAVILTDTRGLWERGPMVHGEHCLFVQPGDADGLRRAMEQLESDPDLARSMGRKARKLVEERYTAEQFSQALAREMEIAAQARPKDRKA